MIREGISCVLDLCRFRVCQLVAKLMDDAVDASCILSYHLQVKIKRAMLIRIHDKVNRKE